MKKSKASTMVRTAACVLVAAACACFARPAAFANEISVLNPRADLPPIEANPLAPRLSSLEGKTVYVNGSDANMNAGNEIMLMVARALAQAEPRMKVVYLSDRYGDAAADALVPSVQIVKNPTDSYHMDVFEEAQQKADAVVTGLGYCGNGAIAQVVLSAKYEKLGIPTVNLLYSSVLSVARKRILSATEAMPYMRLVTIPNTSQEAKQAVAARIVPRIIEALTNPLTAQETYAGPYEVPKEPRIAFTGTYDQVQEFFLGDLSKYVATAPHAEYTDGLPVIPPTEERVAQMLAGTSHKPEKVIGKLAPASGIATVEKVAINAVMAGARPEYMPVLLALTEAVANDGGAQTANFGGGGSFCNPVVVCGPVAGEIGLNSGGPGMTGPAPLSPGVPANMVVGRFLRLIKINIGGVEPGVSEALGIGSPFKTSLVIAEDNASSPWPQMSAQLGLGFEDGASTVSLFNGWSDFLIPQPTRADVGATRAQISNPDVLARYLTCIADAATGLLHSTQGLLLLMGPDVARDIADAGYGVEDVKQWIYEHTVAPWAQVKQQSWYQPWMFRSSHVATIQGRNMTLYQEKDYPVDMPDDTPVKYYAGQDFITVVVGPGTPAPLAAMAITNAHPAWTVSVDRWR